MRNKILSNIVFFAGTLIALIVLFAGASVGSGPIEIISAVLSVSLFVSSSAISRKLWPK